MDDSLIQLANKLERLQIWIESKIQVWATIRDLKPVSTILINEDTSPEDKQAIFDWITSAGLFYEIDDTNQDLLYVSKNKDQMQRVKKIMWSMEKDDHIEKGLLFGYPKNAVLEFANNHAALAKSITPGTSQMDHAAYVRYKVRKSHINEDSEVALKWANLARKEIPQIAREFEDALRDVEIRNTD